jgi:cytoplasmic iron level regulating protein YaaA (DUF328/UPF0246 family)
MNGVLVIIAPMLFLLSPAKSLDFETPAGQTPHTLPQFARRSAELIQVLRTKTPPQLAQLMGISDSLAALNAARYKAWSPRFTARNSKQAVLAFNGDVYDGLGARGLKPEELQWAQEHLRILSGLYGVLRPLDRMQPYRLEMGTALQVGPVKNLYRFWGTEIAVSLNRDLAADRTPVVINLASQEYFRCVDRLALKARVVECVFEDWKSGGYKVISFFAKKARGLMARYAITRRVNTPMGLEGFNLEGYAFEAAASQAGRLVFRRRIQS